MKKNIVLSVFVILSALLFSGCVSSKVQNEEPSLNPVYVTNSKKITLLPTGDLQENKDVEQILSGKYGNQDFSFLCYLLIDENGIFLSLFNEFGVGLGNLSYDGSAAVFDSAFFPKNLKAEYIIFDLQLAYYSSDALENAFDGIGMKFTCEKNASESGNELNSETRKVFDGKKLVEQIEISGNEIKIQNFLRNYSYNLEEL